MAVSDDRLGKLPDEILLFIFSLLPISSMARIAAVCKRWNGLFQYIQLQHTVLDFGQEFSSGRSADELVGSVGLSLRLLRDNKLKGFKLTFYPSIHHMSELNTFLQCLVEKDVEDLELDFRLDYGYLCQDEFTEAEKKRFKLPSCLFDCKMITHFKLSHSDFRIPPDFVGFSLLTELRLFAVNITDEMLERMLLTCSSMETLYLRECSNLAYVKIHGTTLKLKLLAVMDVFITRLDVYAPNLRKFHYIGESDTDFKITNVSSLVDAILCAIPRVLHDVEHNRVHLLDKIRHVEILTVCSDVIMGMQGNYYDEEIDPEILPMTFSNLYELQLLLRVGSYAFHILFQHCTFPSLEKLFIELYIFNYDLFFREEEKVFEWEIPFQALYNLKMVRINSFYGNMNEIMLVEFLLKGAVSLESMILVAAAAGDYDDDDSCALLQTRLSSALKRLLLFPKASSEAKIILYGCGEDFGFAPTHTRSVYAPDYFYI